MKLLNTNSDALDSQKLIKHLIKLIKQFPKYAI